MVCKRRNRFKEFRLKSIIYSIDTTIDNRIILAGEEDNKASVIDTISGKILKEF